MPRQIKTPTLPETNSWSQWKWMVWILCRFLFGARPFFRCYCWWLKSCTTWDVWNLNNLWDKLPTSTGERRISAINSMSVQLRVGHHRNSMGFNGLQAAEKEVIELRRKLAESQARETWRLGWVFCFLVTKTLVICCIYICIYIYGIILPSYMGVIICHYKDPYEPISIMECHKGFLNVAQPPFRVRWQFQVGSGFVEIAQVLDMRYTSINLLGYKHINSWWSTFWSTRKWHSPRTTINTTDKKSLNFSWKLNHFLGTRLLLRFPLRLLLLSRVWTPHLRHPNHCPSDRQSRGGNGGWTWPQLGR